MMKGLNRTSNTNSFNRIKGVRLEMISDAAMHLRIYHGEFDPGSERTLAARLKHASRTARVAIPLEWRTGE